MKRILTLLLSACLLMSCLAGCGGKSQGNAAVNTVRLEDKIVPNRTSVSLDTAELDEAETYRVVEAAESTERNINLLYAKMLDEFTTTSAAGAFSSRIGWNTIYNPAEMFVSLSASIAAGFSQAQPLMNITGLTGDEMLDYSQAYEGWLCKPGFVAADRSLWLDGTGAPVLSSSAFANLGLAYKSDVYSLPLQNMNTVGYMADWLKARTDGVLGNEAKDGAYDVDLYLDGDALGVVLSVTDVTAAWAKALPGSSKGSFTTGSGEKVSAKYATGMLSDAPYIKDLSYQMSAVPLADEMGDVVFVQPTGAASIRSIMSDGGFVANLAVLDNEGTSHGSVSWAIPEVSIKSSLHYMGVDQYARLSLNGKGLNVTKGSGEKMAKASGGFAADCAMNLNEPFGFVVRDSGHHIILMGIVNYI